MPDNFKDWAAIIFGLAGLIISIYNLIRARRSERQARSLGVKQKRLEALQAANEAILAKSRRRRLLRDLQIDAASEGKLHLLPELPGFIEHEERSARSVNAIAAELQELALDEPAEYGKWEEHFRVVVESFSNKTNAAEDAATEQFAYEARTHLKLLRGLDKQA